ncbi:MAG: thermonuclease family protein [Pseudomonas sp.]|uniref:thermonuclease family protein n=1 Tax=Pseudomonas sp. TaxID=306 RepID=UPI0027351D5B|nr:thermonuclease family protein [Pseudomonas sp.]MDP3846298.1 thermonuclease family protein [Pseudomonas sp.]
MPRHLLYCFLLLNLLCAPTFAAAPRPDYGSVRVDEVTSIYDGDTLRVTIRAWPAVAGERVPVRLYGIDTPEMRDKRPRVYDLAKRAKQFSVARLRGAKRVELRQIRRDKYFRLLAEVWVDGLNLSDLLLKAGLAKPYYGGKKVSW